MIYLLKVVTGAEFWIGVVFGTVLGNMIKTVLVWAWNKIPGVPKIG